MQRNIIAPDFEKLMTTQTKVLVLASAYYFSGEEVFAQRAAATLRAFYTDPDTGMRPTLKYAQLRAGSKKGATTVRPRPLFIPPSLMHTPCSHIHVTQCYCCVWHVTAHGIRRACPKINAKIGMVV